VPSYSFTLGTPTTEQYEFRPLNPTIDLRLKENATVNFSLNLFDPVASYIVELITELRVYRDGIKLFQGRIVPSQDSINGDGSGSTAFTAVDYRGLLGGCYIYDYDRSFWFDEDVAVIAQECVEWRQARTGGDFGITFGVGFPALGVVRDSVEFPPGTSIGEGLNGLQESKVRGFDWEVDSDRVMNLWDKRGTTSTKRLDYLGTFNDLTRTYKSEEFSNAVRASGGDQPVPEVVEAVGLASDPRGRWEKEVSWPDTETQETLDDRIEWLLEQEYKVPEEYQCKLVQGFWQGIAHYGLGDVVTMSIDQGRLSVNKQVRVHGISISLPSDSSPREDITLELK